MENEIWLPVVGHEVYFEVSNLGRVKSLDRVVIKTNKSSLGNTFEQHQKVIGVILKQQTDRCGYKRIRTQVNGERINFIVHRLVAKAFIPNKKDAPQVNHKDGNKTNNRVENLEWVNNSQNQIHALETGLKVMPVGLECGKTKYETKVFDLVGNYLYSLYGHEEMKEKGFDPRLVHAVCKGKRNKHRGHTFEKHLIDKENI